MRPLPKEPDSDERKKKTLKSKMKVKENKDKPNISYPTNFEHTVHVGFDAVTGEFTVGSPDTRFAQLPLYTYYSKCTRLTLRCCIMVRIIYGRNDERRKILHYHRLLLALVSHNYPVSYHISIYVPHGSSVPDRNEI